MNYKKKNENHSGENLGKKNWLQTLKQKTAIDGDASCQTPHLANSSMKAN